MQSCNLVWTKGTFLPFFTQKCFHTQATSDIRENPLVTVLGSHAAMTCQIVVGQKSKVKTSDCLESDCHIVVGQSQWSLCQLMVGEKSVCLKKKSKLVLKEKPKIKMKVIVHFSRAFPGDETHRELRGKHRPL